MTRLGMIPEEQFAEDFRQLRRDIEEIKNAQRIGRDIMRPKIVECLDVNGDPTPYDLVTVSDGAGGTRIDFTAIFEAAHQQEPWATPFYKMFYGSPSTPALPSQVSGIGYLSQGETELGKIAYKGSVTNAVSPDPTPIYVKVYFYATDNGVLNVVQEYIE